MTKTRTWTVTMQVEAPEGESAETIEQLITNAIDDDAIASELLDVTGVTAARA